MANLMATVTFLLLGLAYFVLVAATFSSRTKRRRVDKSLLVLRHYLLV